MAPNMIGILSTFFLFPELVKGGLVSFGSTTGGGGASNVVDGGADGGSDVGFCSGHDIPSRQFPVTLRINQEKC